ncbi:tyrosine-type recombinase/integrase [Candidatus Pacearchaeota archaeon]|nr:tyrosine-type recombinase/integrase [Candidatus Pacearchaeota archaeon]
MSYYPIDIERAIKRECERRRYSPRTARTYIHCVNKFLTLSGKTLDKISKGDASEFLHHLSERGKSGSTINVYHMAIRFLFMDILRKNIRLDIKYSKVPLKLPEILTKEETRKLINAISNEKHRLMVGFMYSAGLRVSEMLDMKVCDIDFKNNYGFVRNGKGGKDRIFVLSQKIKPEIKEIIAKEKLSSGDLIFRNRNGKKYSTRSIQKIVKRAAMIAEINKKVHPHTLRHSFATHLIENDYSINEVQTLLGHKSLETTMIYVHLAAPNILKIKSPIDNL